MAVLLLDTNVLVTAKNAYYGMDFVPGFWSWLTDEFWLNDIRSIGAVRHELLAQDDELVRWARALPSDFWLQESDDDVATLRAVAAWTMHDDRHYAAGARAEFLGNADRRIVAMAAAGEHVIATHERSQPERRVKVKIPDAAAAFGVECREPFQALHGAGLHLVQRVQQ